MRIPTLHCTIRHTLLSVTLAAATAMFFGCRKYDAPTPPPAAPAVPDMSIADLHDLCRDRTIVFDRDITIGGYVTSSDAAANFYKTFTIEDASGGAEIMAGITGLHNIYPEGYYITISLKECAAGEHYGVMQIGLAPNSYDYYPTSYFSARAVIDRYVTRCDVRRPVAPLPVTTAELTPGLCGRLVTLGGLQCVTDEQFSSVWEANTEGTWHGYNFFADAAGNTIAVYTSEYSVYASHERPDGTISLTGILQYGKIGSEEYFMIKMRDENDCTPYK